MAGLGEIKFADGTIYQGQVQSRLIHGKGRMVKVNGDTYQGEYVQGKAQGRGILLDSDGTQYDGSWAKDIQHGKGVETWQEAGLDNQLSTMRYNGDYINGAKTGRGRFECDGSTYDGEFKDGKFHGEGKYYFADSGRIYKGIFVNNQISGEGIMIHPDKEFYKGQFTDGKKEGRGVFQFANGDKYVGAYANDVKEGPGVYCNFEKQTKRQGIWKNDKRVAWNGEESKSQFSQLSVMDVTGQMPSIEKQRTLQGGKWRDIE